MADGTQRVRVEEADWSSLLPVLRIFRTFRMAIHPQKLFTALLLIIGLYISGRVLDAIWGQPVYPEEIETYASRPVDEFESWIDSHREGTKGQLYRLVAGLAPEGVSAHELVQEPDAFRRAIELIHADYASRRDRLKQREAEMKSDLGDQYDRLSAERRARLEAVRSIQPRGIFDSALRYQTDCFERLVGGAISLNLGFTEAMRGLPHDSSSVAGSLRDMLLTLPGWLLHSHRMFLAVFCLLGLALIALLGGALARMAALHASRDIRLGMVAAVQFAAGRWLWFVLAPLVPILVILALSAILFLFGLLLFGIPYLHTVLSVVGGLLFIIALLLGMVIALVSVGLVMGAGLLYPAIAVEGSDCFDANSRAFSYVTGRPWQLLFYGLVALVYGAVTYLFVGVIIFLAIWASRSCIGAGVAAADAVFHQGQDAATRFDAILKPPQIGRLTYEIDWPELRLPGKIAAVLTQAWVYLFVGLLAAYAMSFIFCAQTSIYLLLRRSADGTDFDDIHFPAPGSEDDADDDAPPKPAPSPAPEKVAGQASPAPADGGNSSLPAS
ncbi:MAG: hypothetical protein NTW19_16115 [Planctomycetota bacterium]|nr:hypothetical protein [Planctomycetota bacterium]